MSSKSEVNNSLVVEHLPSRKAWVWFSLPHPLILSKERTGDFKQTVAAEFPTPLLVRCLVVAAVFELMLTGFVIMIYSLGCH